MESLLENGRALSNKFQLLIVSVLSFSIGMLVTKFYTPVATNQKIILKNEKNQIFPGGQKQFFIKNTMSVAPPTVNKEVVKTKEAAVVVDYFSLSRQVKDFWEKTQEEIRTKYEQPVLNDKFNEMKKNYLNDKIDYLLGEKKTWFKAIVVSREDDRNKFQYYLKYYPCGKDSKKVEHAQFYKETCYILWCFSFYNQAWNYYSTSSSMEHLYWRDDTPHFVSDLEPLGNISKETNILRAIIPIADRDGSIAYLKYENGKYVWSEGNEIHWEETSEMEGKKFQEKIKKAMAEH